MRVCGVQDVPTFERPMGRTNLTGLPRLGQACGGAKTEKCRAWLQARAPKRTVEGREIQIVVDDQKLSTVLCRVCKG